MTDETPATRLICPLTSPDVETMRADMETARSLGADTVELRLDFLHRTPDAKDLERLLTDPPLETILTHRPQREGGHFKGDESSRLEVLREAARFKPAFIDVEIFVDRAEWPDAPVILSHHDFEGVPSDLDEIVARMEASEAAVNKIAFAAAGPEDAVLALEILRSCAKPTIALAMGEAGLASRILAKKFGSFGTFAAIRAGAGSAPHQPTLEQMRELYRWDALEPSTSVYGVIGCPVGHSMSPAIHNAAFAAARIDAIYLPLRIEDAQENFNRFMNALAEHRWVDFKGLSVTIPHKQHALQYLGSERCDELADEIGAINTITISPDGSLRGDNTDYHAAIDALCNTLDIPREDLKGKSVAILGAGGVARAIVAALAHYGSNVIIYNRTIERGERLARDFSCEAAGLDALKDLNAEIVINCTSVGMHPKTAASPLEEIPPSVKVVFDTIYNPIETRLLQQARTSGCACILGLEMFVNQAVAQFEIWAQDRAPRDVMRKVVLDRLTREG